MLFHVIRTLHDTREVLFFPPQRRRAKCLGFLLTLDRGTIQRCRLLNDDVLFALLSRTQNLYSGPRT